MFDHLARPNIFAYHHTLKKPCLAGRNISLFKKYFNSKPKSIFCFLRRGVPAWFFIFAYNKHRMKQCYRTVFIEQCFVTWTNIENNVCEANLKCFTNNV